MIDLRNTDKFKFLTLDTFEQVDAPAPDNRRGAPLLVVYSEDLSYEHGVLSLN